MTHKFFGISPERFFETIQSTLGVFNFFTAEYNSKALDSSLRPERYPIYELPQKVALNFLNEYVHFVIPEKISYRMDYIFVGPREKELGIKEEFLRQRKKSYDHDGVAIYAI